MFKPISILILVISSFQLSAGGSVVDFMKKANDCYKIEDYKCASIYLDSLSTNLFWYNNAIGSYSRRAFFKNGSSRKLIEFYAKSNLPSAKYIVPVWEYISIREEGNKEKLAELLNEQLERIMNFNGNNPYVPLYAAASYFKLKKKLELDSNQIFTWSSAILKANNKTVMEDFENSERLKKYLDYTFNVELYYLNLVNETELEKLFPLFMDGYIEYDFPIISFSIKMPDVEIATDALISSSFKKEITLENLRFARKLVFTFPNKRNLKWLKSKYNLEKDFETFWMEGFEQYSSLFKGDEKVNQFIDNETKSNQWIILDVWGTWCSPCVKELPDWQELTENIEKSENKSIRFITLSYNSKELKKFMSKNQYTFPVLEITKEQAQEMDVDSFPSTFIISPTSKSIRLHYRLESKQEALKVYSLQDW